MARKVSIVEHQSLEREFEILRHEHCEMCGEFKKEHNTCYLCNWGERFDWKDGKIKRASHVEDVTGKQYDLEQRNNVRGEKIEALERQCRELKRENVSLAKELRCAKNEVCNQCGMYRMQHLGYCNGCRWRDM